MARSNLRRGLFAIPFALGISACGPSVRSALLVTPQPEPRPLDHAVRFYVEARPRCPHDEIGTVTARKRSASMEGVLEAIRVRVREMGGDAVTGLGGERQITGAVATGSTVVLTRRTIISGTVIRFRDSSCIE